MSTLKSKVQKDLKSSDICRIIDSCKKSQVSELRLGDLHIRFGPVPDATMSDAWTKFQKSQLTEAHPPGNDEARAPIPRHSEDYLAQLNLEDPVAYERLMAGDTEDAEA